MPADETLDELNTAIERATAGDKAAWDRLFAVAYELTRERVRAIMGYSFPRLQKDHDATSITNRLYIKLHTALMDVGSVRPANLHQFLAHLAHHTRLLLLNLAKQADRRPVALADSHQVLAGEPERRDDDPANLALWTEIHERIPDLLTPEEFEVFALRYYGGWKSVQIARLLGMEAKPVSRLWIRAVEKVGDRTADLE